MDASKYTDKELKSKIKQYKKELVKRKKHPEYHWYLYVLELEHGYFYVGASTDPERRFRDHSGIKRNGKKHGAKFTQQHKPICILETKDIGVMSAKEAEILENELTLEYARKHGAYLVRGGKWCGIQPQIY